MYTCIYIHMYMFSCMCVTYIIYTTHIHVHTHTHMHIHIDTHTHTHTHTLRCYYSFVYQPDFFFRVRFFMLSFECHPWMGLLGYWFEGPRWKDKKLMVVTNILISTKYLENLNSKSVYYPHRNTVHTLHIYQRAACKILQIYILKSQQITLFFANTHSQKSAHYPVA